MASTDCGYCGRLVHMTAASGLHVISVGQDLVRVTAAFACPNCLQLSVASERRFSDIRPGVDPDPFSAERHRWEEPAWLPLRPEVREFPDVPDHIAQAASEATLCLSVGAFRAVGSLARAVVESIAKDKGAVGGNLRSRIEALREDGHVRTHTEEQAHEVRYFGNDMAHGDFVEPVTREEAEEVVALMSEVLDEVYQSPARLERRRAARVARRDSNEQ